MPEKKIIFTTDAAGLDDAMLRFFNAQATKAEVEAAKLMQETKTLAAEEMYFEAQTRLAVNDLKMFDDPEAVALRKSNLKLRARKENRELQRELSTQGRREPQQGKPEWRKGTQPVQARPEGKKPEGKHEHKSGKPLTHHIEGLPAPESAQQEAAPS